ncbi:MAG: hypothetical protein ACK40A_17405, partial [Pannonibacter indicus]
ALARHARHGLWAVAGLQSVSALWSVWAGPLPIGLGLMPAGLLLAALEHGLAGLSDLRAGRAGFQRTTAGELAAFLSQACQRLCGTVLGRALARLPRNAQGCPMAQLVAGLEDEWRLALRQMLIATPFEAALAARIELVTGFLRLQTGAPQPPQQRLIEDTAALVLGLIAPAQPQSPGSAEAALPGL